MNNSLATLIADFRNGTSTPSEITRGYLEKIESCEERGAIFRIVSCELAEKQAADSDKRYNSSSPFSSIDGIPLAWKDNIHIAGFPTSAGVPKLAERVSNKNATIYKKGLLAGTVCLGKTNMNELAFSGLGIKK